MEEEGKYRVRISGTAGASTLLHPAFMETLPRGKKQLNLLAPVTSDVPNEEVENLLKGLLLAFEHASTDHYCVRKAKTSIVTTRNAEGKLGISLGLNIFKIFDAEGNVKGERTEGIEIEIERTSMTTG